MEGLAVAATPGWSHLPGDLAITIASLLEAKEVCALGCCSRLWRSVCTEDTVWRHLFRRRWPNCPVPDSATGWMDIYIARHQSVAAALAPIISYVKRCSQSGSLESGFYLKSIADVISTAVEFQDVKFFLFNSKLSVLLNLIGLHYSIVWLKIPPNDVLRSLIACQVENREVLVSAYKLGRWFYGYRLPDEPWSRKVSLAELATIEEVEVISMLNRGAIHEILRLQVTAVTSNSK